MFAIVALTGIKAEDEERMVFNGASKEFETQEDLLKGVSDAIRLFPKFRALTIVHSEDLPLLMENTTPKP